MSARRKRSSGKKSGGEELDSSSSSLPPSASSSSQPSGEALAEALASLRDLGARMQEDNDHSGDDYSGDPLKTSQPLASMVASTSDKELKRINVTSRGKLVKYETAARMLGKKAVKDMVGEVLDGRSSDEEKSMSGNKKKPKKTSKRSAKSCHKDDVDPITARVIKDIWENLGNESINLKYAIVGYLSDGRPVIEHEIFVGLLVNYGYRIDHVLAFIDDFNNTSLEDKEHFPCIMLAASMHDIYSEVEHLKPSIYEELGLEDGKDG